MSLNRHGCELQLTWRAEACKREAVILVALKMTEAINHLSKSATNFLLIDYLINRLIPAALIISPTELTFLYFRTTRCLRVFKLLQTYGK